MTTAIKRRRGTTTQHATFTGLEGELTVDTTKDTVVVHDGSTAGGFPLAKESQATSAVAITGGSINGTTVGATTAAAGKFTTLEATGVTTVQAGTVSAPAITTTGDTNTGIFFPAADTIAFTEGGVESMRIDSSGNVGIGLTNPAEKLDVYGAINLRSGYNLQWGSSANYIAATSSVMLFQLNSSERMRIDSSGNVGIGTTSPGSRLEIAGSTGVAFTITQSGTTTGAADTGGVIVFRGSDGSNIRDSAYIYGNKENSTVGNYASYMSFWTRANGVAAAERMRITSSGNVGIGTSSPNGKVDIVSSSAGANTNTLFLTNSSGTAGTATSLVFGVGSDPTNRQAVIRGINAGSNAINLAFLTSDGDVPAERMRITSAGAVLIGTTSTATSSTLNIDSAGYQPLYVNTTTSGGGGAAFSRSGTQALYTGTAGSSWLTGSSTADGLIRAESNLLFASNGNTERMRITSGGYVKASNNGTYDDATGTYHEFNQNANGTTFVIKNSNASFTGAVFNIQATRNTTNGSYNYIVGSCPGVATRFVVADSGNVTNTNNSYGAISDVKLKENIVDATPKLEDLCKVKVRRYNLKSDPDHKQIGVVAQELEQVFAGLVETVADKDVEGNDLGTTTKQVKYSVFVPMLIKAIQEQQQIINDLKARIETLESK